MPFRFLNHLCRLTPTQQRIFLFAAEKRPYIYANNGDISFIANSLQLPYKTVFLAVYAISSDPELSKVVRYIRKDIAKPVLVSLDAVFKLGAVSDSPGLPFELPKQLEALELQQRQADNHNPPQFPTVTIKSVDNEHVI